ncbi:MAG: endonuclease MutS2 [Candidatus Krumholzibacteriia bacterium]
MNRPLQKTSPFAHAAGTLEFGAVVESICERCRNEGARELLRALHPTNEEAAISDSLREIAQTREYQQLYGTLPIPDTSARRWFGAEERDVISPEGLIEVAAFERATAELRRSIAKEGDRYAALHEIASRLRPHDDLVAAVENALESDGRVRDGASRALKRLRAGLRRARDEIRTFADRLAKSVGSPDCATFNGSRYMLVVPREKCRRREGIVHSRSHSGGSLYFEPLSLVEKNNALETTLIDEAREEARIVGELTALVEAVSDTLTSNAAVVERLDALNAKAAFATEFKCVAPAASNDGSLRVVDARHPLLEISLRAAGATRKVVPLNLRLDRERAVLVITGPNAGGKTVALKTVGLLVLVYQSGLPVPCAEGSEFALFDKVFADIGDEQSIASSLSTFTSHLRHLDAMCRDADDRTLCLIDEIGDGTDPDEGAALAIASLERLQSTGATVIATTHYGRVKAFALGSDGVENASMLFDDENDRPLYRLLQGTAGRSRGIETARRLDFFGPVIERAREMVGEEAFRLEQLLSELEGTRLAAERDRRSLADQSRRLNALVESYDEKVREMKVYEGEQRENIRREAADVLLGARKEIESIVKQIRETGAARQAVRDGRRRMGRMAEELQGDEPPRPHAERIEPGDLVSLSPTGSPNGPVLSVVGDRVAVEINGKTINTRTGNLYRCGEPAGEEPPGIEVDVEPLAGTVIDVRGQDRGDALSLVDRFIDGAVLNGVREITIIHGIGGGVLRTAIRSQLKKDSRVKASRPGAPTEGGAGVTIATLG